MIEQVKDLKAEEVVVMEKVLEVKKLALLEVKTKLRLDLYFHL